MSNTFSEARALLIEADEFYRSAIAACIEVADGHPQLVHSPELAFSMLERRGFDLLVWGVTGDETGRRVEIIGELRLRSAAPLVVVDGGVAVAQVDLEAGADQWLPKPFAPGALVGSRRAALRKSDRSMVPVASRAEIHGMVLDGGRRKLILDRHEVSFTRQEWDLLTILACHPNRFLGAQEILRLGWRAGEHAAEQLRTYVHRLRLKLQATDLPCRLLSQHGRGYCLTFD
jgi:DNA-binding response OmpR family regulator